MPTSLLKNALRISASGIDGYRPDGWSPKLQLTVMGPTPSDSELVWAMLRPDGSAWFETITPLPDLAEEATRTLYLQPTRSGADITETGACRFTLRVVNELDGVDELLHDGVVQAHRRPDSAEFVVDNDAWLSTGWIGLDVVDEADAPAFRATVFIETGNESIRVEAHLFHEGNRIAKATDLGSGDTFTTNQGNPVAEEFEATFAQIRAWNNLAAQGWGDDDWHLLDRNPGHYQVKFTINGKVARTMSFDVADGRIVADDLIESDPHGRPVLWRAVEITGAADGSPACGPRAYGGQSAAAFNLSSDDMYRHYVSSAASDPASAPAWDEATLERVETVVDRAERLINFWEADLQAGTAGGTPMVSTTQCEIIIMDVADFEQRWADLGGIADAHQFELRGETVTVADAARRVFNLRSMANAHLGHVADEADAILAPYRAVLRHDKLAIFEDHPAPDYRYYTTNRHVIESPEALAEAEFWFFEGSLDATATATINGASVDGRMHGWRVLGYRFDDDHRMVDEFEEQGSGPSAPKSAFGVRS